MGKQPMAIISIANRITTEEEAYLYLEELRWGKGDEKRPVCPHCGLMKAYFLKTPPGGRRTGTAERAGKSSRRIWKCAGCRKQFSVTTGTIFHATHVSLRVWLMVIFEMCANKNGVAAREIERKYDLTPKSAWFVLHRIREAMKREPLVGMLSGTIVADETFIGGKASNRHRQGTYVPGKMVKSMDRPKVAVLSLLDTATGEVRSRVVPDVTAPTLANAIREQVNMAPSVLHTNGHVGYRPIGRQFQNHQTVDHSRYEYVRGNVTTNHAEGYFSQLKRSIDGTHHRCLRNTSACTSPSSTTDTAPASCPTPHAPRSCSARSTGAD